MRGSRINKEESKPDIQNQNRDAKQRQATSGSGCRERKQREEWEEKETITMMHRVRAAISQSTRNQERQRGIWAWSGTQTTIVCLVQTQRIDARENQRNEGHALHRLKLEKKNQGFQGTEKCASFATSEYGGRRKNKTSESRSIKMRRAGRALIGNTPLFQWSEIDSEIEDGGVEEVGETDAKKERGEEFSLACQRRNGT